MHHNQSRWNYRHLDNTLLVHYADLKADPHGEIRRIANFLDIEIADATLAHVVDRTRFGAMRQQAIAAEAVVDGPSPFREGARTLFSQGDERALVINLRWLQGDAYIEHRDAFGPRIFAAVVDLKSREPLVRLGS